MTRKNWSAFVACVCILVCCTTACAADAPAPIPITRDNVVMLTKFFKAYYGDESGDSHTLYRLLLALLSAENKFQFEKIAVDMSDDDLSIFLAAALAHTYNCLNVRCMGWKFDPQKHYSIHERISLFRGQEYKDETVLDCRIGYNCFVEAEPIFGSSLRRQVDKISQAQAEQFGQRVAAVSNVLQDLYPTTCKPPKFLGLLVQHLIVRFGRDNLFRMLQITGGEDGMSPLDEKQNTISQMEELQVVVQFDEKRIPFPSCVEKSILLWTRMEAVVAKPLRWIRSVMFSTFCPIADEFSQFLSATVSNTNDEEDDGDRSQVLSFLIQKMLIRWVSKKNPVFVL